MQLFYLGQLTLIVVLYIFLYILATCVHVKRHRMCSKAFPKMSLAGNGDGWLRAGAQPAISFIIPVYNASEEVIPSVRRLLQLNYHAKKIIIVNDGSVDSTLDALIKSFNLVKVPPSFPGKLATEVIINEYYSLSYHNLIVVDKLNGGDVDAINAGLNVCTTPLYMPLSVKMVIDQDRLLEMIDNYLHCSDQRVLFGAIGIGDAAKSAGKKGRYHFPKKIWNRFLAMHLLENSYLASGFFNGTQRDAFLLPLSIGLFQSEKSIADGGYCPSLAFANSLHFSDEFIAHQKNRPAAFLQEPIGWIDAERNFDDIAIWQKQQEISLSRILKNCFPLSVDYGFIKVGLLAYEVLIPLLKLIFFLTLLGGVFTHEISLTFFLQMAAMSWGFAILLSWLCILGKELTNSSPTPIKDLIRMLAYAPWYALCYYPFMATLCARHR